MKKPVIPWGWLTAPVETQSQEQGIETGNAEKLTGKLRQRVREALARNRKFFAHDRGRRDAARLPEIISFAQDRAVDIVALLPHEVRRRARGMAELTPVRPCAKTPGPNWLADAARCPDLCAKFGEATWRP